VRVEDLRVALRPRTGWEAVDLGFVMAREWWRPVWGAWLAAYLPLSIVLTLAFWSKPIYAALIIWWLKPVFDRVVLHVLSRAVFGDVPTVRAALTNPEFLRRGMFYALTFGRLSLARSFLLPVAQLEGLTGREAAQRRAALGRRDRGYAVGLTVACMNIELVLLLALGLVGGLLAPAAGTLVPDLAGWFGGGADDGEWWSLTDGFLYLVAVSIIEPLYVAGGFALYLNRRTLLEGWDIEVALRGLAQRLATTLRRPAAAALAAACLGLWLFTPAADAVAKSAREEIREVLKAPEFPQQRDDTRWVRRDQARPAAPDKPPSLDFLAQVLQAIGWLAAAAGVIALLYIAWRYASTLRFERDGERYRAPDTLFGLSITPESLPEDVAAAAASLAREGRLRDALSLLYRGALSALVNRYEVPLQAGDTEGDCVRLAARTLQQPAATYFGALVGAWQGTAYAGRAPDAARVLALADEWRGHFAVAT
jgi:hypothetical protein